MKRLPWLLGVPALVNVGSVLLSFVARILLARIVGPAAFGVFTVWYNNVFLFGTLGTFGQQNFALKELAQVDDPKDEAARRIAIAIVRTVAVAALVFGIAGALLFATLQNGPTKAAWLQIISSIAVAVMLVLSAIHRGLGSIVIGLIPDRLAYQLLFLAFLLAAAAGLVSGALAISAFTVALIVAALLSIGYLLKRLGQGPSALVARVDIRAQTKRALPYFTVNVMFVINARYLLSYAGIYVDGGMLGQVGMVFTIASMMIIPTSTMNLIVAPKLARRLANPAGIDRIVLLYLSAVAVVSCGGLFFVYLAHGLIFSLSHIDRTIPSGFVFLICSTMAVTLLGNGGLIVEQFLGRAGKVARLFAVIMTGKLIGGYAIGKLYGIEALFWTDLSLGTLFVTLLIGGLLVRVRRDA